MSADRLRRANRRGRTNRSDLVASDPSGSDPLGPDLVPVTFELPPGTAVRQAALVAEFALWTPLAMDRNRDGSHCVTVRLARGRRWRYQFLVDGEVRMNDPTARTFERTASGGAVSVVHV